MRYGGQREPQNRRGQGAELTAVISNLERLRLTAWIALAVRSDTIFPKHTASIYGLILRCPLAVPNKHEDCVRISTPICTAAAVAVRGPPSHRWRMPMIRLEWTGAVTHGRRFGRAVAWCLGPWWAAWVPMTKVGAHSICTLTSLTRGFLAARRRRKRGHRRTAWRFPWRGNASMPLRHRRAHSRTGHRRNPSP